MANRRGNNWSSDKLLFSWAPKSLHMVTASHEIKRHLLLGRKAMTNLDSILKNRDTTLPTKVHLIKAMVFPVVMYGCESRTIKKAECQRIDAFELWCWRRLESPLDCKIQPVQPKGNQSWTKSLEKTLMLGKIKCRRRGDDRGWDCWMASRTQWTWVWVSSRHWWWTGKLGVLRSMESKGLTRLRDWTELNWTEALLGSGCCCFPTPWTSTLFLGI